MQRATVSAWANYVGLCERDMSLDEICSQYMCNVCYAHEMPHEPADKQHIWQYVTCVWARACGPVYQCVSVVGVWEFDAVWVNAVEVCVRALCRHVHANTSAALPLASPRGFLSSWCFLVSSPSGWRSIFIQPGMTPPLPHPSDGAIFSPTPRSVEDELLMHAHVCEGVSAAEENVEFDVHTAWIWLFYSCYKECQLQMASQWLQMRFKVWLETISWVFI